MAKEASGIRMESISKALNAMSNATKVTSQEMSKAFAPLANAAKVTSEEMKLFPNYAKTS